MSCELFNKNPEILHATPLSFGCINEPCDQVQERILWDLQKTINRGDDNFAQDLGLQPVDLVFSFASEDQDIFEQVLNGYNHIFKPRGRILHIRTVSSLREAGFDEGRRYLVNAPAHNAIILEVEGGFLKKTFRVSMQGNYFLVEGSEEEIITDLARWVRMHYEPCMVTERSVVEFSDQQVNAWLSSPVHSQMSEAAKQLLENGIIEDRVNLEKYANDPRRAKLIMRAINRSALGESMRAMWDGQARILGVTISGGGKGSISSDPNDKSLAPVIGLTDKGYIAGRFRYQEIDFDYPDASVEAHEIARLLQAISLIKSGAVNNLQDYESWFSSQLALNNGMIPIIADKNSGLLPDISFDHVHWYLDSNCMEFKGKGIYISEQSYFKPAIDAACGSRYGTLMSLSALFTPDVVNAIRSSRDFNDIILVLHLPGHGSIWLHGNRKELTEAMVNLKLVEPERV